MNKFEIISRGKDNSVDTVSCYKTARGTDYQFLRVDDVYLFAAQDCKGLCRYKHITACPQVIGKG